MEQFRQIGEVLGSMKALIVLQEDHQINKSQCSLLFDMFNLAFDTLTEEIKQNLKLEEKNMKWKPLEQPLKELHRVVKEGEAYMRQCCMDSQNWWVKAIHFHNNQDCVESHIHNLLCHFPIVVEAIETAGEISGLDIDDMKKKRVLLSNKYDKTWNDPKLFQWKYGRLYLIPQEMCHRLRRACKEDRWLLLEMIKDKTMNSPLCKLTKQEQRLADLLSEKLNGVQLLHPTSILTGAKDYQVRRRLGGGMQYKEIQWLGESYALRHFFAEPAAVNSITQEISALLSNCHPNIVQYLCGFQDEEKNEYFLLMELISKDLSSYIKEVSGPKRRVPFTLPVAVDIMLQIARGMEYLHSQKIYHGDLKPSNVLIKPKSSASEGFFTAKVSGFGLRGVKTIPSRGISPNQNETLPFIWYAPEVLAEQEKPERSWKYKYSEKADVYSFGMLCFELLTGKVPFEDGHLQGDSMSRNIRAGERPLFPFALPKYLGTLTRKCWQTDPAQRPTFISICRILRYVKRLIVLNPHLAHPEIPSIGQVDFCDIEVGFMKKFPVEAAAHQNAVSQIPFQLFSYRLEEKEKLSLNIKENNWDSHSEVVLPTNVDDNVNMLDSSFSAARDTKSVCSDTPENRHPTFKTVNGVIEVDQYLRAHDTMSVCSENPDKKGPRLRKSNSASGTISSSLKLRSVFPEIPEKRPSPMKKLNSAPSLHKSDTKSSTSSDGPEKKAPEKKIPFLRKSGSVRTSKDQVKPTGQRKGPSVLSSQGHSTRVMADKRPSMTYKLWRSKRKTGGHLTDSEIR